MKKKRSQIGCLFWVGLILLVLVVALFNRPKIEQVLRMTNLHTTTTQKSTKPTKELTTKPAPSVTLVAPGSQPGGGEKKLSPTRPTAPPSPGGGTATPAPQTPGISESPSATSQPKSAPPKAPDPSHKAAPAAGTPAAGTPSPAADKPNDRSRKSTLYFVKLDASGKPALEGVTRVVSFYDSPLTRTIDTLLEGITANDKKRGLLTLIPNGSKLLDARVSDGTAYLNFNDTFRFNSFGREGYEAELKQIVYTATQFSTVKRVQFLVNGTVRQYLGPEGSPINAPLDRRSLAD